MKKGTVSVISALIGGMAGAGIGAASVGKVLGASGNKAKQMSDKHLALFLMMNQWVRVKQENKCLSAYFEKNNYKKIAIYGMSYAGETLVEELKGTSIEIVYGIDRKADEIYSDIDVYSMEDDLQEVDAVVVTAITYYDKIQEQLATKLSCPIISLEDLLYEI